MFHSSCGLLLNRYVKGSLCDVSIYVLQKLLRWDYYYSCISYQGKHLEIISSKTSAPVIFQQVEASTEAWRTIAPTPLRLRHLCFEDGLALTSMWYGVSKLHECPSLLAIFSRGCPGQFVLSMHAVCPPCHWICSNCSLIKGEWQDAAICPTFLHKSDKKFLLPWMNPMLLSFLTTTNKNVEPLKYVRIVSVGDWYVIYWTAITFWTSNKHDLLNAAGPISSAQLLQYIYRI